MLLEELCEIEGGYDADRLRVCKFLVCAFVDALEKRHRIVDKHIDASALRNHVRSKSFEGGLVGKIANKPRSVLDVDYVNRRVLALKAFGAAPPDALRPTSHDDDFVLKRHKRPSLFRLFVLNPDVSPGTANFEARDGPKHF